MYEDGTVGYVLGLTIHYYMGVVIYIIMIIVRPRAVFAIDFL